MKDVGVCEKPREGDNRPVIRGCPNGETQQGVKTLLPLPEHIGQREGTWGSETSQYPQEEKTIVIPLVAASERGHSPNHRACTVGL